MWTFFILSFRIVYTLCLHESQLLLVSWWTNFHRIYCAVFNCHNNSVTLIAPKAKFLVKTFLNSLFVCIVLQFCCCCYYYRLNYANFCIRTHFYSIVIFIVIALSTTVVIVYFSSDVSLNNVCAFPGKQQQNAIKNY